MEGAGCTGTARPRSRGVRAVPEPIEDEVHVTLQELYVYTPDHTTGPRSTTTVTWTRDQPARGRRPARPRATAAGRGGARTALPAARMDDCPGLCTECGARLADDPDHAHDAPIDPRWAGLQQLSQTPRTDHLTGTAGGRNNRRQPWLFRSGRCRAATRVTAVRSGRPSRRPSRRAPTPPAAPSTSRTVRAARAASTGQGRPSPGPLTTDELRAALGDPVLDPELLQRALTHRSYAYEKRPDPDQRAPGVPGRLGARGRGHRDALPRPTRTHSRGPLAKLRAAVVNARALAGVAREIAWAQHIMLGRGEETTGGRDKASILSDTVEAVIGAIHLSGGMGEAAKVCPPPLRPR